MVKRVLFICVVACSLAGCGAMQAQQRAEAAANVQAQKDAAAADCRQQFPTAPRTNHVALARCLIAVQVRYWGGTDRDLLDLFAAKDIAISTQMDEGKITQEDGNVLIQQAWSDMVSGAQQRANANRPVFAQQAAAMSTANTANSLQQAGAALQAIGAPPRQPMTCTSMPGYGGVRTTTCQ